MPLWILAGFWGLVAGSALLIGALLAYFLRIPKKLIAFVMAFGSGILISALAFNLMDESYRRGGYLSVAGGFLIGAAVFTAANVVLARKGAAARKRSGTQQPSEQQHSGSGLSIAIGSLLDGIPESIAIGVSMIKGGAVGIVTLVAVFLSNIPEGMSSTAGMKKAGRPPSYIFGIWGGIAVLSGLSALAGYSIFSGLGDAVIAFTLAIAAGAILSMLVDTMIPEAFDEVRSYAGLITVIGFLIAFVLAKLDS